MDDIALGAALRIENNFGRRAYAVEDPEDLAAPMSLCLYGAVAAEAAERHGLILTRWSVVRVVNASLYADTVDEPTRHAGALVRETVERLARVIPKVDECCLDVKVAYADEGVVYHYNDEHCDGGVGAAKLLREAAEVEL